MTPCLRICLFTQDQYPSTEFVWAPVPGSTKFWEWFTVWCWYPREERLLYARHSSEMMSVPGKMYVWMIGMRVAALLSATTIINDFVVPLSMPPKTQCPSTPLPRLYFRLPNLLSSISTIFPRMHEVYGAFSSIIRRILSLPRGTRLRCTATRSKDFASVAGR